MSAASAVAWTEAQAEPESAAPLRAVDQWHAVRSPSGLTITARVAVRADDPNLRGHFPGLPIFPGVFIIETVCQAMTLAGAGGPRGRLVLRAVRSARFLAPAVAGDELVVDISAARSAEGEWDVRAEASRGDGSAAARIRAVFATAEAASG
jgi:3-hydroxyacyl-[acyl-carrier-protein] dehydratase